MSEYTIFRNSFGKDCIANPNGVTIAIGTEYSAVTWKRILEDETAPLLATIALQNANLEAAEKLLAEERAKSERYKRALERIETNAPKGDMPPLGTDAYSLWVAGKVVEKALKESEAANDSPTG